MDKEQIAALLRENEKLGQENDQLKWALRLVKTNQNLRDETYFNNDAQDELPAGLPSETKSCLLQTLEEGHFGKHMTQTRSKREHRTSSPVHFKSFIQSSVHANAGEKAKVQSCQAAASPDDQDRLLGEIAYQLDRRVLSHIFQGHRLYGFTLLNVPQKIVEVSTHPLTGKVDEDYRHHLTQRHADLMVQLNELGYKTTLHPVFTEFIVNTYGILKEKPDKHSNQAMVYNNPDVLRRLIMTTAPGKLQKDLLLLLTCLCYMAGKDKYPLILW